MGLSHEYVQAKISCCWKQILRFRLWGSYSRVFENKWKSTEDRSSLIKISLGGSWVRSMSSCGKGSRGGWAKHLVKRNYKLWLAFGKNRRSEHLTIMVQSDRQLKQIFFPGGDQGKGWWKLVEAAFELAKRPVNNLRSWTNSVRTFSSALVSESSFPKMPWKVSIRCPHCEVPIQFTVDVGDT